MIDTLISALSKELELSAEEIADTIWLALQIQESQSEFATQNFDPPQHPLKSGELDLEVSPETQTKTSKLENTVSKQPSDERKTGIYPCNQYETSQSSELSFKVPDAPSLREPLTLARALKPLMRRIPSSTTLVLDEAATTQQIADKGLWLPVLRPTLEPWLDLELVVDESISMQIWRPTIRELERLLKNYGIFRDVRVWGLLTDDLEQVQIRRGIGATAKNQSPRSPAELIDPSGRRLILVVSDCVSSLWRDGKVTTTLELWAKQGSMAIVQMLPKWLWKRTALGRSSEVRLQGLTPGEFNQKLIAKEVSLWDELEETQGVKVPVFTLEADKVETWAQMLSGKGSIWTSGYVFKLGANPVNQERELFNLDYTQMSAEQRVQAFRVTASPMARKLAGLLAAAPVISLPIVRLIRETLLDKSQQVHVAEVFLGGLLKPLSEINADTNPNYVQYEFMDGVRELLVDSVPSGYVLNVVDEVSKYVARKVGLSLEDFAAILRNPQQVKNSESVEEVRYFATVTAQVLRRLGGKYTRFAEDLEKAKKYWLFQGNPKIYRIFDAIQDLKGMPWPLNRYTEEISVGDEVLIWLSGKESGIYAFGEIIEPVKIFEEVSDIDYWINTDIMSNLRTQAGPYIRFTTKLLDQPLLRKELKQDPILKNLSVIRINRGSIFKVTPEEWKRIHEFRNLDTEYKKNSKKGIDYTKLSSLLAAGKWREADEETARLMFKIADREKEGWLRVEDIKQLPSSDLQTIDRLWIKYSNGRFGFSVQKQIYQSLGGTKEFNQEITENFWKKVGLLVNNQSYWLQYDNLIFNLSAPLGHLPIRYDVETPSDVLGVVESLISRPDLVFQELTNKQPETLHKFTSTTPTVNYKDEITKTEIKTAQDFTGNLPNNVTLENAQLVEQVNNQNDLIKNKRDNNSIRIIGDRGAGKTTFIATGALNPVEHQNIIIHRKEFDRLREHLENKDTYIVLQSPRQTGKTTLLYQIQHHLHGNGYGVVYLDCSGLNNFDEAQFYQQIAEIIQNDLEQFIDSPEIARSKLDVTRDLNTLENYLKFLSTSTSNLRKIIIIMDEIGGVPDEVSSTFFPHLRKFFHKGRGQSKERYLYQKILFIFSGVLDLNRLMQGENSPLYNICECFTLKDFSQEEALTLARNFQDFSEQQIEVIVSSVYDWCAGHPYPTQRLYRLVDENQEYRNIESDRLLVIINQLVETHIFYGNDANKNHILNYLENREESYHNSVREILYEGTAKTVPYADEIITVGIFKRLNNHNLAIRNRIYEAVLKNFFRL